MELQVPLDIADQRIAEAIEHNTFPIHRDNWRTIACFIALDTQWRIVSGAMSSVYQGIEYASIPPVLDAQRVPRPMRARVFEEIRLMEAAAVEVFSEPEKPVVKRDG